MSAMMFSNILLYRKEHFPNCCLCTTVVIAARNEEQQIQKTIESIVNQDYRGNIRIIVVDNASKDRTAEIVHKLMEKYQCRCKIDYIYCGIAGKFNALNSALKIIDTDYFITVDADTYLHKDAVQKIMDHICYSKSVCVAGNLYVFNARESIITKMQIYDYLLSIAAVKRFQGSYHSTLVAQGAFSVYETEAVREVGGWEDVDGEDIVLTYKLLENGGHSTYEPYALAYTVVPVHLKELYNQRKRWASGMLEGLSAVKPWKQASIYSRYFCSVNLSVIYLDLAYIFGFIPGLIMAINGHYYFVGGLTIITFIICFWLYCSMYLFQKSLAIPFQDSFWGFIFFFLFFQFLQSMASLEGYYLKLFHRRVVWK